ncbi:hypothetical protein KIN20_026425 [Parelaphostrongylus tenuis]|uniref:Uncharacterized protein n=1 Tax=Parelaphostrongylus tenuis TaxID=148309 RepID=A0AAD5QY03_PARTN|nr:hypothetical protein KIN20_026425 [Parelaphostrongylus tenuis]
MAGYLTGPLMVSLLATMSTVFGCGVMPPGQARTISFTVTGFTLPLAMVYTEAPEVFAQIPGIATSEAAAKAFVKLLVMQKTLLNELDQLLAALKVFDVLEGQGRSALLPDAVISSILSQLSVQVNYNPMKCQMDVKPDDKPGMDKVSCIIVGSTVTGICATSDANANCLATVPRMATVTPVPDTHLKISGNISTTNMITASWSRAMWQNGVIRAIRMLAWSPFGSHFISRHRPLSMFCDLFMTDIFEPIQVMLNAILQQQ